MKKDQNKILFRRAAKVIPGGVNSPVRAFGSVGGTPCFIQKAKGAYLWDETGKKYLDFCASWGPMLLGHTPDGLLTALRKEAARGTSFGAATRKEVELAEKINLFFPSMEKARLVSSGTEAVMSAIRLARGFTGRSKILKIDGGYHGHADSLLVKAGSGLATFGIPGSAGVPKELAKLTLTIPFNDEAALERIFKKEGKNIAAFIIEPVPANMGVILPRPGYLQKVRAITKKYGTILIFDEVITGFRLARGGAQEFYNIRPDLTTLGKILGGGLPIAAFGGRKEIMNKLAPLGPVYQAGTLSGNPIAVSAALWMLKNLENRKVYRELNQKAEKFYQRLRKVLKQKKTPVQLNAIGSMFTLFFTMSPVTDYQSAKTSDTRRYATFFHALLQNGIYTAPSQFEANFISAAHTAKELSRFLSAAVNRS